MDDVNIIVSVSVSSVRNDPYFDRHQSWTREQWDETFQKKFPTFSCGFIDAIENYGTFKF